MSQSKEKRGDGVLVMKNVINIGQLPRPILAQKG